jgi:hypothetical protein
LSSCADHRALRDGGDARRPHQAIAPVRARQEGGEVEGLRPHRLDILGRVHREVDPPLAQPLVELLGPQRLAADFRQRPVEHLVPARQHGDEFDRVLCPAVGSAQARAGFDRLRHRERGIAGAEAQSRRGCGCFSHG